MGEGEVERRNVGVEGNGRGGKHWRKGRWKEEVVLGLREDVNDDDEPNDVRVWTGRQ